MALALKSACLAASIIAFAVPAAAQELYGTLKKIKDSGTIVIGHNEDSPPFASFGADGKPQGYSIDICGKIAQAVKERLGLPDLAIKYQRGERTDPDSAPRQRHR